MAASGGAAITLQHRGRRTVASLPETRVGLEAFRNALVSEAFVVSKETSEHLELKRPLRIKDSDWPLTVIVEQSTGTVTLICYMSIPWSWIILFAVMVLLFLPLGSFAGAPVAFLLAVVLIALALYKQRFDLRPRAWWQAPSRKRWCEKMQTLVTSSFGGNCAGVRA
jgi:hypothetical protein